VAESFFCSSVQLGGCGDFVDGELAASPRPVFAEEGERLRRASDISGCPSLRVPEAVKAIQVTSFLLSKCGTISTPNSSPSVRLWT